jgi:protease secretion system outer membrane protein
MSFYEKESAKENRIIGRSYLLPSVSASYSASRNVVDLTGHYATRPSTVLGNTTKASSHPRYISRSSVVQLRQPILNLDGIARYRQGKVIAAKQGEAAFASSTDEVTVRVASAYMDALFADDQWRCPGVARHVSK